MIEIRKKTCKCCKTPQYIWSRGFCKVCWHKAHGKAIRKSEKHIKKQSEKGKERHKAYVLAREEYFITHPICERCRSKENLDLHHKSGRDGENLYRDYMTVCRSCHQYIHEHVEESYRLGYLLSRLNNDKQKEDTDNTT